MSYPVSEKRLAKKQRRKEALLLQREPELEVSFQAMPSVHVFVGNGGLRNGISRALLQELLATPHIYMPPEKDYAFATFSSVTLAEVKVKALNGVCVQTIPNTAHLPAYLVNAPPLHLYLSFISTIPECVTEAAPIAPPSLPPGLVLVPNFITSAEEEELLTFFDSAHTNPSHLKHRQVFHYGYQFNYDTNNVDICAPLPGGFPLLIQHLVSTVVSCGYVQNTPDQITVNCYPPGAGIPPHVDTHSAFKEEVVSLSLGSQVVMDFRHVDSAGEVVEKVPVLLPARSLLVMSGPSRYLWSHGIATRLYDPVTSHAGIADVVTRETRVSVTFRAVRKAPCVCKCDYPLHCDSHAV